MTKKSNLPFDVPNIPPEGIVNLDHYFPYLDILLRGGINNFEELRKKFKEEYNWIGDDIIDIVLKRWAASTERTRPGKINFSS